MKADYIKRLERLESDRGESLAKRQARRDLDARLEKCPGYDGPPTSGRWAPMDPKGEWCSRCKNGSHLDAPAGANTQEGPYFTCAYLGSMF